MRRLLTGLFAMSGVLTIHGVVEADEPPVLVAYGDSITAGLTSGPTAGPGYAQVLADRLGWGLQNYSAGGQSATFYGRNNIGLVILRVKDSGATPGALLVAFGTNDMTGDYFGRKGTPEDFYAAMTYIVDTWQTSFPDVPVYVGGILWRTAPVNAERPIWNAQLERVAEEQGARYFLSGMQGLRLFPDGLHPSARGHARLGTQWYKIMA